MYQIIFNKKYYFDSNKVLNMSYVRVINLMKNNSLKNSQFQEYLHEYESEYSDSRFMPKKMVESLKVLIKIFEI